MAMIGRRQVLAAGLAIIASPVLAQAAPYLRPKARPDRGAASADGDAVARACAEVIAAARLGGTVGYAVADLGTGTPLGQLNSETVLPPASVSKAVSALYALDRLGPDHRFATQVLATGPLEGGVVQGDLILAGGGDPSLDTDRLGDMAGALARAGVRGVRGQFLVWGGALPSIARIADDQPDYAGYNPTIAGLMLNFNRAQFVWGMRDGRLALGVNAEGARFNPPVGVIEVRAVQRQAPLFTYDARTPRERWSVAAPALQDAGSRWLPVRAPSAYAGDVFAALCAAQGITLPSPTETAALPQGVQVLAQDRSGNLDGLLRGMLRYSNNLTAEAIGLAASGGQDIKTSAGAMTAWAQARYGILAQFVDHSGLGAQSICTPQDMLTVMLGAEKTTGQSGALMGMLRERRIDRAGREAKDGPLRILAKSGTLNFVSNLAGYVTAPSGRMLAFAIFAADSARRAALPLDQRENPVGGSAWAKRARAMQRNLIAEWAGAWL